MSEVAPHPAALTLRAPAGTPTLLRIFDQARPEVVLEQCSQPDGIASRMARVGVQYARWKLAHGLDPDADAAAVRACYRDEIDAMMSANGYGSFDVISVSPATPDLAALRGKFLAEHTHAEDEVRFFVHGHGLFTLHLGDKVYELLCTAGDLLNVPAGTRHWFDMGPHPDFKAIRLFTNPDGWVAELTGDAIASRFSRLDNHPF